MKIKRPDSPLQGSPEPLDQQQIEDLSRSAKGVFAEALSQLESVVDSQKVGQSDTPVSGPQQATKTALLEIAKKANLSNGEAAANAVRESASYMIRSRLTQNSRDSVEGRTLIKSLSEYVANDPLLKPKLLSILKRLKSE
jgi:hypothetical protein